MKASISLTTLFKSMVAFILLFAAFLVLAITYNKAYRIKNESIAIIEKYEGVTEKSLSLINNYQFNSAYKGMGKCKSNEYGAPSLEDVELERVTDTNKKYYYCLSQEKSTENKTISYRLRVFYKFNLPLIGDLTRFSIAGETKPIKYYNQDLKENY